jgi:AcrR family transcriptional regulator
LSPIPSTSRRTRSDGERSRTLILQAATALAATEGLRSLSIDAVARCSNMSKSGIFAHFGSKEALQIAIVETAAVTHEQAVVHRAVREPTAAGRLRAICDNFLDMAVNSPGGTFFTSISAEVDRQPGPVRDTVRRFDRKWFGLLTGLIAEAQADGDLPDDLPPAQVAFEIRAMLHLANSAYQLHHDPAAVDAARNGIGRRLTGALAP